MDKNFYRLTILLALFVVTLPLFGQHPEGRGGNPNRYGWAEGIIKGKIIDNDTKQPVEYANLSLFSYKDSSLTAGTITNAEGIFTLDKLNFGKYYLKIDFIGYQSKVIPNIKVTPNNSSVYLGNITYTPSVSHLNEVTISDNKSLVEYKLDKKIVNVEQDLSSIGGNAVDVLKNVPSVQVDMDDNVSIRGSSNITILIDGKRTAFASNADVLQQIPTSAIASIELITNPSAKYNPEGLSGIINIILKKNKERGINLTVSTNGGTNNHYGGSVDFNAMVSKFNFLVSYNLRNNERGFSGTTNQTNYFDNDSTMSLTQMMIHEHNRFSQSIRGGFDYFPNDNNTISLSSSYQRGKHNNPGTTNYINRDMNNVTYSFFDTYKEEVSNENSIDVQLNWEKKFNNPEQKLITNASYSSEDGKEDANINNYFSIYNFLPSDSIYKQQSSQPEKSYFKTFQTDYTHPLSEFSKIETGIKIDDEAIDDNYLFENYNSETNTWESDTNTTNRFVYREQIYAGYITFASRIWSIDYLLGLRLEQVYRDSEQKTSNESYKDDYFKYYPTIHISKELNKKSQLQLSYSRRIDRPHSRMLNPFKDYSNPLFIRQGNPALMPEMIDSYEFTYQQRIKSVSLTSAIFYKKVNDAMERYRQLLNNNVMLMTFANINSKVNYGLEFSVNTKITKWWQFNGNASYFKNIVDATDLGENSSTAESMNWTGRLMSMFMLPKNFSVQLTGFYNSPSVTAQGSREAFSVVSLGAKKTFKNRKWTISANYSDILNTFRFHFYAEGEGFTSETDFHRLTRMFYVSVVYHFNTIKDDNKRNKQNSNMNQGGDNMMNDMEGF